jgi:hypothetical protein
MQVKDITPSNVQNFIEGNYRYHTSDYPEHYLEQFLYRAYLCQDCLNNGKCKICKCKTPQLFFAPRKHDAMDKWPDFFFSATDWENYKNRYTEAFTTTEAINKARSLNTTSPSLDINRIISDAKSIIDQHREQDLENPSLSIDQAEEILQAQGKETRVQDK